jgi:DNA invertase Pin-like site-specific DNA recombinase
MMGPLAEFERALIAERTRAGMHAAHARGACGGRRPALTLPQAAHARKLVENGESPAAVARSPRVGWTTRYRALKVD